VSSFVSKVTIAEGKISGTTKRNEKTKELFMDGRI
jgi:hypothetical protein